ncbi:uncharacterized protein [Onthophagus taurus]|uniref:uncharacterized protein isoform X1 n=2 Tax=Onthophagus taurus TaxID=166361 RepID=UPI0039BE35E5
MLVIFVINTLWEMSAVKILNTNEVKELQKMYEHNIPYASHVNSLFIIYFNWKKFHPDKDYLHFHVLGNDWKRSGTFLLTFRNFDIFMFTLDKTGEDLLILLNKSKLLKIASTTWNNKPVIYGIRNEHLEPIYKSIQELEIPIKEQELNKFVDKDNNYKIYFLSKEDALKYTIDPPDDVYIDKLNLSHVDLICSLWPNNFPGAKEYLSTYIEMNTGYGVFLKENGQLVSWIMQNFWGTLIVLETIPEFKRKGYGSLIVKKICVEIAKDGINPLCTIYSKNYPSQNLFTKLGFECIGDCTFLLM